MIGRRVLDPRLRLPTPPGSLRTEAELIDWYATRQLPPQRTFLHPAVVRLREQIIAAFDEALAELSD